MFKSKEKMEIERKIRIRKSKTVIQSYISKLERLQKRVFTHGKEYAKLGESQMVKNQASSVETSSCNVSSIIHLPK